MQLLYIGSASAIGSAIGAGAGAPPIPGVYIAAAATTTSSVMHAEQQKQKGLQVMGLASMLISFNDDCCSMLAVQQTDLDDSVACV